MTAAPVTMVIGAPVSEALLGLDGRLGLHGWQWLFLVEGFPAVVLGVLALRFLTDRPEDARVARRRRPRVAEPDDGRGARGARRARSRIGARGTPESARSRSSARSGSSTRSPPTACSCGSPRSSARLRAGAASGSSAITAIPFLVALVGMVLIGRHSDRTAGAEVARRRLRADRGARPRVRGPLLHERSPDRGRLRAVAARPAGGAGRLLGHPADLPRGQRRRGGHRADQRGGQPRRLRRAHGRGVAARSAGYSYAHGLLFLAGALLVQAVARGHPPPAAERGRRRDRARRGAAPGARASCRPGRFPSFRRRLRSGGATPSA